MRNGWWCWVGVVAVVSAGCGGGGGNDPGKFPNSYEGSLYTSVFPETSPPTSDSEHTETLIVPTGEEAYAFTLAWCDFETRVGAVDRGRAILNLADGFECGWSTSSGADVRWVPDDTMIWWEKKLFKVSIEGPATFEYDDGSTESADVTLTYDAIPAAL